MGLILCYENCRPNFYHWEIGKTSNKMLNSSVRRDGVSSRRLWMMGFEEEDERKYFACEVGLEQTCRGRI